MKGLLKLWLGKDEQPKLRFKDLKNQDGLDLIQTIQRAWGREVMDILDKYTDKSDNLCVVGGCALNGITNYDIQQANMFKRTHFIPNPTDCGLSAGAALSAYYKHTDAEFNGYGEYFSPYVGSKAFDLDNLPELQKEYPNREVSEDELPRVLAKLISQDQIVGVIRGGYEIGPRALGNRSILCNPLNRNMRDILNEKVKHREWFRPFAPVATAEDAKKYFTHTEDIPYMSVICYTREEFREDLPAITHVDGSARLQTVTREQNTYLYDTLKEFEKITGKPILVNDFF